MKTETKPNYARQLAEARRLLAEKGREALNNPHAMTGRICRCGDCFCCAALQVLNENEAAGKAVRS